VIVICAYCGYKGLDNYALYAVEVLGMNEVESARFTSLAAYLRPVAAVAAGFLADRWLASKVISAAFLLLLLAYAMLVFQPSPARLIDIVYANLVLTFIAVFGIRGVYFALLEETGVERNLTGSAVGLISLAGFTPDIFFAAIAGRLLDAAPGIAGHQHYFAMLAMISAIGVFAALSLACRKKPA
jgi:nitrate/nitrite transporter NarK